MRDRAAVVVPPAVVLSPSAVVASSQYEVLLVSSFVRCPLRGRYRMPVTTG
ncbi:hypothetical protein AB0I77_17760 [Streptomyces sp. NPDC050619]|uniref:hypothetical protein n=1 Tax=Streptomyces sp. NPDC050619 TaxID=3157214 RepID=UPI00342B25CE